MRRGSVPPSFGPLVHSGGHGVRNAESGERSPGGPPNLLDILLGTCYIKCMAMINLDTLTKAQLSLFIDSIYDKASDSINCDAVRALSDGMPGFSDLLVRSYGTTLLRYAFHRVQVLGFRRECEVDRARRAERHMDAAYEALPPWLQW